MGKKKKDKKVKVKKHTSGVEERIKSIHNIQIPDENPHKMQNEEEVGRFFKFGLRRAGFRQSAKETARMTKRENRPKKRQGAKF